MLIHDRKNLIRLFVPVIRFPLYCCKFTCISRTWKKTRRAKSLQQYKFFHWFEVFTSYWLDYSSVGLSECVCARLFVKAKQRINSADWNGSWIGAFCTANKLANTRSFSIKTLKKALIKLKKFSRLVSPFPPLASEFRSFWLSFFLLHFSSAEAGNTKTEHISRILWFNAIKSITNITAR